MDLRLNGHDQYTPPRRLLGPDGLPITSERYGGDGYPLPHVIQMGAIAQSGWEVYWDRWDEARRHSRENALAMEKDCFLQALLQERALATSTLKWHVHCEDEKDPYQKALKDGMQRVLGCTPHKTRLNYQTLKNGMWYGRGASQLVWEWREISVPVVKAMPVTPPGIMPPAGEDKSRAGRMPPSRGEEAGDEPQPFLRERYVTDAGGREHEPAGTPEGGQFTGGGTSEKAVAKLHKAIVGTQAMTQKRAKAGGEVGPNGEDYPGGAFIATQDIPKRIKAKIQKSATGKVQVDGYAWATPEPGEMSILDKLGGTVLNPRDGSLNYQYLEYSKATPEEVAMYEELAEKWRKGERWVAVKDYPAIAGLKDAARLVVAGQAVPGEVLEKMPEEWQQHLKRYQPPDEKERHLATPPQHDPFAGGLPGNPAGTPAAVTVADERRRSLCVKRHQPVHGDSIYHKWDGTPVVLTYAPAQRDVAGSRMTWTTAGSIATVLAGTWRERFIVYSHESKPAEFFDYEKAEAIHGSGLRDVLYWSWWMKSEYLEWITTFYERFGLGLRLWGYEAGNKASYDEVFALATASSRRVNVMVPIFGGKSGQQQVGGLTAVETPVSGAEAVRTMLEYFDAQMERYVVGQSMSGGADSESGLGGTGRAKFAANTKYQLVKYDAENLADCYTSDWLRVSQRWTYPEARDVPLEFRFNVPDPDNQEKLEGVEKAISFGVDFKKDEVRGLTGMSDPQPGDDIVGGMAQQATEMAAELMAAEADQPPPGGDRGEVSGALPFRRDGGVERHVTDAAGHEHRPAGEGGGQFTGVGGGHELSKKANAATQKAMAAASAAEKLNSPGAHKAAYKSHRKASDEHYDAGDVIGTLAVKAAVRPGDAVADAYFKRMLAIAHEHDAHRAHHQGRAEHHRAAAKGALPAPAAPAGAPVRQEGVPEHTTELLDSMRVRGIKNPEEAKAMDEKIAAHLAPIRASRSPLHEQIKATLQREGEDKYGKRMKDAYEAAATAHPGLTVPQFHAALLDLKESGAVDFDPGTRDYSEDPENVPFILPYPNEDPRTGFKTRVERHAQPAEEKDRNVVVRALKEVGRAIGLLEHDRGMAQTRRRKVVRDEGGNIVGLVDEYPEVERHTFDPDQPRDDIGRWRAMVAEGKMPLPNEKRPYPYDDAARHRAINDASLPVSQLEPLDLTATQDFVVAFKAAAMKGELRQDKPILAVRHGGKHYIEEGHHRAVHALLTGQKVPTKVVEIGPDGAYVSVEGGGVEKHARGMGHARNRWVTLDDGQHVYIGADGNIEPRGPGGPPGPMANKGGQSNPEPPKPATPAAPSAAAPATPAVPVPPAAPATAPATGEFKEGTPEYEHSRNTVLDAADDVLNLTAEGKHGVAPLQNVYAYAKQKDKTLTPERFRQILTALNKEKGGAELHVLNEVRNLSPQERELMPVSDTGKVLGFLSAPKGKGGDVRHLKRKPPGGGVERHVTDASGHEHKPAGTPEGGQFTGNVEPWAFGNTLARKHLEEAAKHPRAAEIFGKIPAGSMLLGAGREALAYKAPAGHVVRLGKNVNRPPVPEVLQPTTSEQIGEWTVENLPFAEDVNSTNAAEVWPALVALDKRLGEQGYVFSDFSPSNVGKVGGEWKIIDPGEIKRK